MLIENSIMQLRTLQEADGAACRPEFVSIAVLSIQELQNEIVEQCKTTGEYACIPVEGYCGLIIDYQLIEPANVERDLNCDIGFLTATTQTLNALAMPLDPDAPLTTQSVRDTLIQTRLLAENSPTFVTSQIDTQVTMLEAVTLEPAATVQPFFNRAFIRMWVIFVGIAYFIGLGLGMNSLNRFVGSVRKQVPRPFYYSVAQMSRVVAWEANIALEIGEENFDHIEWRAIGRTTDGGIHLRGMLRDYAFPPDSRGLVRATIYEVETDRWGKIVQAEARSGKVPPKPQPPTPSDDSRVFTIPVNDEPPDNQETRAYQPIYVPLN